MTRLAHLPKSEDFWKRAFYPAWYGRICRNLVQTLECLHFRAQLSLKTRSELFAVGEVRRISGA